MLAEHGVCLDLDDVASVVGVVVLEVLEDLEFYASLVLELLLVSDDFDGYDLTVRVVYAFQGLSKAAFAKEVNDFRAWGAA